MKRVGSLMAKGGTEKLAAMTATTVAATGESVLPASLTRAARQERPFEQREMVVRVHPDAPICGGSSDGQSAGCNNPSVPVLEKETLVPSGGCKPLPVAGRLDSSAQHGVHYMHEVGGSSPSPRATPDGHAKRPVRSFQLRWREPLGLPECPYAHRTLLNLGLFSVRVHEWHRSDDKRFLHDHPWHFVTLVLRGSYTDVSAAGRDVLTAGSIRYRRADHAHYVEVPVGGCLTILVTSKKVREWGFWMKGKFVRPLRFFGKFGHPPCNDQ